MAQKVLKVRQKNNCSNVLQPIVFTNSFDSGDCILSNDLGRLHCSIPFKDLASKIPSPPQIRSGRGRKPFLKVEGGIALLVLKHYTCLSDEMLIDG